METSVQKTVSSTDRRLANLRPPWKPGERPVGAGRPKGVSLTANLLKILSKRDENNIPRIYKFSEQLILLAQNGNPAAIKVVTDRIDPVIPLSPVQINLKDSNIQINITRYDWKQIENRPSP